MNKHDQGWAEINAEDIDGCIDAIVLICCVIATVVFVVMI